MDKNRKLTEKEIIRREKVQRIIADYEEKGYQQKNLTISIKTANVMAFVLCLPICAFFVISYFIYYAQNFISLGLGAMIGLLLAFIVGTIVHEGIHGAFWGFFSKNHFKSIEFGFIAEYLTPYCTCLEPLTKGQYFIGSVMPGVFLGIVPSVFSLVTGSLFLLFFGCFMIIGAGGDFTILLKLFTYKTKCTDIVYLDHPTECGLIVLER